MPDVKEYQHQYYLEHMPVIKLRAKQFYEEHKEEFKERAEKANWYKDHPEERKLAIRRSQQNLKIRVLTYYGGGNLACVRCGYSDIRALSLDHINGNGYQHRKELKANGVNLYRWLEKNGHPQGFQTLCMNCNFIKREEDKECQTKLLK